MIVITHDDIINQKISPRNFFDWATRTIENKKMAIFPDKVNFKTGEGEFYHIMPCLLPNEKIMGFKHITRQPYLKTDAPTLTSQIFLYSMIDGDIIAMLDGNLITAMRTGAVAIHSMQQFACKDFQTIGMMGFGVVGISTMDILVSVYPERKIDFKLYRYKDQAEVLIDRYKHIYNYNFTIVDTMEELVGDSDIIISSVGHVKENFVDNKYFKEGVTVIPIQPFGFENCNLFFDKIYTDDIGYLKGEGVKNINYDAISEVSDVVMGKSPGRKSSKERIIAYSIGIPPHDLYAAKKIVELRSDWNKVKFSRPKNRMWIK